jgi:HemY protein
MRLGALLLLALAGGALIAHLLMEDVGYVLINIRGYAIEMSVPGLLLALLLLYLIVRLLLRVLKAPRQLGRAVGGVRSSRARKQVTRGLIAVAEGNAARGERLLTRGARRSETPLLNYMAAAQAAQVQGADQRRDDWLKLARERSPEAENAVLLTQAELQIDHGQLPQAIATLERVGEVAPNNHRRLTLLAKASRASEDWEALRDLLPRLIRTQALARGELATLQRDVCAVFLQRAAREGDAAQVDEAWHSLPKASRADPAMFALYAAAAARCGDHDRLERMLRKALKTTWSPALVATYGELETSRPAAQLAHLEAWLARRGDDAELLLAAARLCIQNQLWGKARSYLESSLSLRPDPHAYRLYGELLDKMGEADAAAEAFRQGLEVLTRRAALPAPESTP